MEHRNDYAEATAKRVAEQIKEHGVTITWLSERSGIPRVTLHRRLCGASAFTLGELDRIADALRISTACLLGAPPAA